MAKDKNAPPPTCPKLCDVSDKGVSKKQKTVTSTMVTVAVEFWTLKGILFHWNRSVSSKRLELNFFSENNSLPWNHENGINIWIEIIQAVLSFPVSNDNSIYEWSDVRQRTEQNIQIVYFIHYREKWNSNVLVSCLDEEQIARCDVQLIISSSRQERLTNDHVLLLCVRWLEVTHKDEVQPIIITFD